MTDDELLNHWAVDRVIVGNGSALAYAFDRKVKGLEDDLSVAIARAQAWRDLCSHFKALCGHYKELAEARNEKLAKYRQKVPRGPCGIRNHAADCDCGGAGGDR